MKIDDYNSRAAYLENLFSEFTDLEPSFSKLFCTSLTVLECSLKNLSLNKKVKLNFPSSEKIRDLIFKLSSDISFYQSNITLHKECIGNHNVSLSFRGYKKKKKADEMAKKLAVEALKNSNILSFDIKVINQTFMLRKKFQIVSSVKYVNNYSHCSCPSVKKRLQKEISITSILKELDKLVDLHQINFEAVWLKIGKVLFL